MVTVASVVDLADFSEIGVSLKEEEERAFPVGNYFHSLLELESFYILRGF